MMSTFSFFRRFNNFNDLWKDGEFLGTKNGKSVILKIKGTSFKGASRDMQNADKDHNFTLTAERFYLFIFYKHLILW